MKKFSKYDNTTVRITSKYGDTFTGACQWFPWEYGWSEFGVKEEGLQIGEYILFDKDICRANQKPKGARLTGKFQSPWTRQ